MRYSEIMEAARLDELLNTKVDYEVTSQTNDRFVAQATINGRLIKFTAEQEHGFDGKAVWEVLFGEYKPGERGTFQTTGNGGELEVLSMVTDATKEFVDIYQPDVIRFSATKDGTSNSRAQVYDRMLRRNLPAGYQIKKLKTSTVTTDFWIEKK